MSKMFIAQTIGAYAQGEILWHSFEKLVMFTALLAIFCVF